LNELPLFSKSASLSGRSAFKNAGISAFIMIDPACSDLSLNAGLNIRQISGSRRHSMTFIGFLELIENSIAFGPSSQRIVQQIVAAANWRKGKTEI
jgi:hypothetical protein